MNMDAPQNEYLYPQAEWQKSNMIELVQESDVILLKKVFDGGRTILDVVGKATRCSAEPQEQRITTNGLKDWSRREHKRPLKVLVCSNITPYRIDHTKKVRTLGKKIISPFFDNSTGLIRGNLWSSFQHAPKILIRGNDTRITAVIDETPSVFIGVYGIKLTSLTSQIGKYLVVLLNSTLYQWIFLTKNPSLKIGGASFRLILLSCYHFLSGNHRLRY